MPHEDNLYPTPFIYPFPSFSREVTPPDVDPDEGETILVAYNPDWSPVLMAAVTQLLQYSTWLGDHDEKILATERAANLQFLLQEPFIVPEREYPAPYWDDDTSVEDAEPADEQDWYGYVEDAEAPPDGMTFRQNAVVWLLAGFVAIASGGALPVAAAAALTFRTVANKFVMAFNRGDVREQFRIIIDQTDYAEIDTDDLDPDEIIDLIVDDLPEAESHEILIVVTNPI